MILNLDRVETAHNLKKLSPPFDIDIKDYVTDKCMITLLSIDLIDIYLVIDFFNDVNFLYAQVVDHCNSKTCPEMVVGAK